jgi:hypothetical protein
VEYAETGGQEGTTRSRKNYTLFTRADVLSIQLAHTAFTRYRDRGASAQC